MTRVALITAQVARPVDDDLAPLLDALAAAGAEAVPVDWDDPSADWSGFDLAVIRSPWDYTTRVADYLRAITSVAAVTDLHNPVDLVRWNSDKRYLADMAAAGLAVVPTSFFIDAEPVELPAGEFVVKPTVSAGSRDTARFGPGDHAAARELAARILAGGRAVMVQPYVDSVDARGETALLYFDGELSHAIGKGPLLERGAAPTRALFAAEHITPTAAAADEVALGDAVIAYLAGRCELDGRPPLYGRVDLVRGDSGAPMILEVELNEPSVFLAHGPTAASRFARAILARVSGSSSAPGRRAV